jgi:hypothetical protein
MMPIKTLTNIHGIICVFSQGCLNNLLRSAARFKYQPSLVWGMAKKSSNDVITINKKMLTGIAPLFAIAGVLLAKSNPAVILLIIGVVCGFIIGKNYEK